LRDEATGTGIMGMMGTKGGVAVSARVNASSFAFLNAHLAANQDQVARRNQDFTEIRSGGRTCCTGVLAPTHSPTHAGGVSASSGLKERCQRPAARRASLCTPIR
jgi:hypothetical protein